MKTTLIIQARVNSKRYNAKVLKKFGNLRLIEYLQKRFLLLKNYIDNFILAVPAGEAEIFKSYLINGFHIIEGPEYNLLERYFIAFKEYESDLILRATSDNPYVSLEIFKYSYSIFKNNLYDYIYIEDLPIGTQVEFISKEAFLKAYFNSNKIYQFEHVTPYIYENPSEFKIYRGKYNKYKSIKHIRLTLDEKEDYEVLNKIGEFYNFRLDIDLKDIFELYNKRPDIFKINTHIKQKKYNEVDINEISIHSRIW